MSMAALGRQRRLGVDHDVFVTATCYASATGRERPKADINNLFMIKKFFDNLLELKLNDEPTEGQLNCIGVSMVVLAKSVELDKKRYRKAIDSEELVYPLYEADFGPSLYLVSDAAGVQSAPHEHQTWAVIVGLSGNELNVTYEIFEFRTKTVKPVSETEVKSMDFICLSSKAIHSTCAAGREATYHLHLYGQPLHKLPSYQSRCYSGVLEN